MSDDYVDEVDASPTSDGYGKSSKRKEISPHINDIVSGRGSGSNRHEGNLYFRKLIRENKELYLSRPKNEKMLVARDIYNTIEDLDPPGRFLQKNPETGSWFEIGKDRALEKISQALREKNSKQQMPNQASHFAMGMPSQFHGFDQNRLHMSQSSFGGGINPMTSHANQGYGQGPSGLSGQSGPPFGGFDLGGNDLMAQRGRSNNSFVSDSNMFERRIAELREAKQQMMRGGGGLGGPNDLMNQGQYQNSLLSPLDAGRGNFDFRRMDPSLDNTFHSATNIRNRQSSWFQESQPLPSLPEVPRNRYFMNQSSQLLGNQSSHLLGNQTNTNGGLSLFESERSRVARQNEYLNSLSSAQGMASQGGGMPNSMLGGNPYLGLDTMSPAGQLRNNQIPFVTPEQQLELNQFLLQRQQEAAIANRGFGAPIGMRPEEKSRGKGKRKRKKKLIQSSKESTSESKRSKTSKSDASVSSRSSLASSIEPSTSNEKETPYQEDAYSTIQRTGVKGTTRGMNLSQNTKMPSLKSSSEQDEDGYHDDSVGEKNYKSDGGASREESPTAGLDALSKAASLMRR